MRSKWIDAVRKVVTFFTIVLVTIAVLDLSLWVLPVRFEVLPRYKTTVRSEILGRGGYPHDYFQNSDVRGFDIKPMSSGKVHFLPGHQGYSYPIWSNKLGCFDNHSDVPDEPYAYVAGDSFAWGHTRFETRWSTVLEQRMHMPVLNCAVTHTGQLHQLSKMKEIVGNRPPKYIVVSFSHNDLANDYFFPHTRIINGWMLDDVDVVNGTLKRLSDSDLVTFLEPKLKQINNRVPVSPVAQVKAALARYSATYNVVSGLNQKRKTGPGGGDAKGVYEAFSRVNHLPESYLDGRPVLSYSRNVLAQPNRNAIREILDYSNKGNSKLIFLLIPPKEEFTNRNYYSEVRRYLQTLDIKYLDLSQVFDTRDPAKYYWTTDSHLNEEGNEFVGTRLYQFISDLK